MSNANLYAIDSTDSAPVQDIAFQDASLDIWDKKYRLKTKDGDAVDQSTSRHLYKRVARGPIRSGKGSKYQPTKAWYKKVSLGFRSRRYSSRPHYLQCRRLCEHKPATSTINCTVSGTIQDSMDNILEKAHEAGLTLKAGCGHWIRLFDAASSRRLRFRRRCLHLRPTVIHGYLRQDVFHRVLGWGPTWSADGDFRCPSPRCF